jgi:hypothetical protein
MSINSSTRYLRSYIDRYILQEPSTPINTNTRIQTRSTSRLYIPSDFIPPSTNFKCIECNEAEQYIGECIEYGECFNNNLKFRRSRVREKLFLINELVRVNKEVAMLARRIAELSSEDVYEAEYVDNLKK